MVREILIWPDPRLREKAKEVTKFDDSIRTLVADMFETMYATGNGVGLAATQLGVGQRVVVIDTTNRQEGAKPLAFINPVIVATEGKTTYQEGCLSVPGEADGLLAIALQHETDHLDGILFVDHLSALKRELIKRRMKRLKAEREEAAKKKKDEERPAV